MEHYSLVDFIVSPFYLFLILFFANRYAKNKRETDNSYRYYLPGLCVKIIGGIMLALVYTIYYPGGDTVQYFKDAVILKKLMFFDFNNFWAAFTSKPSLNNLALFNSDTGYPAYISDTKTWTVVRLVFFLNIISFDSFLPSTILCATISFTGIWKLYKTFQSEFPSLDREMAISFLFIPSVFFWGSGILKDTFTIGALGYLVWCLNQIFYKKKLNLGNAIGVIIPLFLILSIKAYIVVGLLPAIIVTIFQNYSQKIKAPVLRILVIPVLAFGGTFLGYIFMVLLDESLGEYKLENILNKAVITQRDLKMDYYQGNSFDIGDFDATLPDIISKFPIAVFSAIFRPLIVESNNTVMFISGLENLFLLLFTFRILFTLRFVGLPGQLLKNHLLIFAFVFALFFSFAVGLTTSNFGSLVRYKIPGIPFFVASLYLFRYYYRKGETESNVQLE